MAGGGMSRFTSFAVATLTLCSGLCTVAAAPAQPKGGQTTGLVVESVDANSPPGKAGIRSGDILIGWERAANPPANPVSARGDFSTPMDLEEVCVEESQRGRLIILGTRNGRILSFAIPAGLWDEFQLFGN